MVSKVISNAAEPSVSKDFLDGMNALAFFATEKPAEDLGQIFFRFQSPAWKLFANLLNQKTLEARIEANKALVEFMRTEKSQLFIKELAKAMKNLLNLWLNPNTQLLAENLFTGSAQIINGLNKMTKALSVQSVKDAIIAAFQNMEGSFPGSR